MSWDWKQGITGEFEQDGAVYNVVWEQDGGIPWLVELSIGAMPRYESPCWLQSWTGAWHGMFSYMAQWFTIHQILLPLGRLDPPQWKLASSICQFPEQLTHGKPLRTNDEHDDMMWDEVLSLDSELNFGTLGVPAKLYSLTLFHSTLCTCTYWLWLSWSWLVWPSHAAFQSLKIDPSALGCTLSYA